MASGLGGRLLVRGAGRIAECWDSRAAGAGRGTAGRLFSWAGHAGAVRAARVVEGGEGCGGAWVVTGSYDGLVALWQV